jgi:hypothetical protein
MVSDTKQPLLEQGLLGNESIDKPLELERVRSALGAAWICTNRANGICSAARTFWRLLDVICETGKTRNRCSIGQAIVHGVLFLG